MAQTDWDDYDEVLAAVMLCGMDLEQADDDLREEEEVVIDVKYFSRAMA